MALSLNKPVLFARIGTTKQKWGKYKTSALALLLTMKPDEQWVLLGFIQNLNFKTNKSEFPTRLLANTDTHRTYSSGLKKLIEKNVLKPTGKVNTVLFNPLFFHPDYDALVLREYKEL